MKYSEPVRCKKILTTVCSHTYTVNIVRTLLLECSSCQCFSCAEMYGENRIWSRKSGQSITLKTLWHIPCLAKYYVKNSWVVEIYCIIMLSSTSICKHCKYVKATGEFPLVNLCHERFWAWACFSFQLNLCSSKA